MAKKKNSTKTYEPYLLPSVFNDMDLFIQNNKTAMTEQVVSSIEYALSENLETIEIFRFKRSDFVITLSHDKFEQNLQNIYDYYIATEKYELCPRIKALELKIKFKFKVVTYKLNSHEKK